MAMKLDVSVNRVFKDTIFIWLFGNRKALLELYNAIRGTNYGPETDVFITTLENVLTHGRHNDLSFVLDDRLVVLIEHQSTINDNMPLRMLLYIAAVYEKWLAEKDKDVIFREKMISIPRPEFIVLYNGIAPMPDEKVLKLSDMFAKHGMKCPINLELVVRVININKGHNKELAQKSETLDGYATFVHMTRENEKTMSLEDAIIKAVVDCINQNVLKEFLMNNKTEVVKMLLEEWTVEKEVEVRSQEAWEGGREEGREEGRKEGDKKRAMKIAQKMKNDGMDISTIVRLTDLTVNEVLNL